MEMEGSASFSRDDRPSRCDQLLARHEFGRGIHRLHRLDDVALQVEDGELGRSPGRRAPGSRRRRTAGRRSAASDRTGPTSSTAPRRRRPAGRRSGWPPAWPAPARWRTLSSRNIRAVERHGPVGRRRRWRRCSGSEVRAVLVDHDAVEQSRPAASASSSLGSSADADQHRVAGDRCGRRPGARRSPGRPCPRTPATSAPSSKATPRACDSPRRRPTSGSMATRARMRGSRSITTTSAPSARRRRRRLQADIAAADHRQRLAGPEGRLQHLGVGRRAQRRARLPGPRPGWAAAARARRWRGSGCRRRRRSPSSRRHGLGRRGRWRWRRTPRRRSMSCSA